MSTIHLITAHHLASSLNQSMSKIAENLLSAHYTVLTSDLYAMQQQNHPATKNYGSSRSEQDQPLIKQEQQKLQQSDLVILQFPLYWFSMPGIMKNYWEQILEPGFAYPGKFENSPLNNGRRIAFAITTQSTQQDYSQQGCNGDINTILEHLFVTFRFVGFKIDKPFILFDAHNKQNETITKQLEQYKDYLNSIKF